MFNPIWPLLFIPGHYYELAENFSYVTPKGTKLKFLREEYDRYEFEQTDGALLNPIRILSFHSSELSYYFNGNSRVTARQCECGSDNLKHPGHSSWCPLFKEIVV